MIIRLAPDLVDEIRRVEAQGGTAQIKFDSSASNPSGNVIDVGGKDFKFTWSHELDDLCDIYEEHRSGDDGNGLLVESGCPWRKLNVQRILDESTKKYVKMRREEAELKLKSSKPIVLDHGNPSAKYQMKSVAAAAVDSNPRRMGFKSKKEPAIKKQKVEPPPQVAMGGPPNSVFKAGLSSSATPAKARLPLPSPEQPVALASPFRSGTLTKAPATVEIPQASSKENTGNSEKVTPSRSLHSVGREVSGTKKGSGATTQDLQSMLINLLLENPKGMSLKALEKALGDSATNCTKKIEPIIEKIATSQTPGRYFLKPGVDLESLGKPSFGSGSSPEFAHDQTPLQESNLHEKATAEEFEHQTQLKSKLEESNVIENIEIRKNSPDTFDDKKVSDNSEGHPSSSESESDSDSDSSDSGSDSGSQSGSRSKSRSPAGSGSSSDSESDGSSSSKEGSDVEVDIMTGDDDKEEPDNKLQTHVSTSPMPWRTPDDVPAQNGINEDKQDGRISYTVDVVGDDDTEIDILDVTDTVPSEANTGSLEETVTPFPAGLSQPQDGQPVSFVRNVGNESQDMNNYSEPPDSSNKMLKGKPKRDSDLNYFDEKSGSAKRLKPGSLKQPQTSGRTKDTFLSENPEHLPFERPDNDVNKDHNIHITKKVGRDGNSDTSSQKGYNLTTPGKSVSDAQRLGQRSGDLNARGKAPDMATRYADSITRGIEHAERSPSFPHDNYSMSRDKHKEPHDEDFNGHEKSVSKSVREGDMGDKQSMPSDSHFRRYGEEVGKAKDARQMSNSHMGSLPKDKSKNDPEKSPLVNGKAKVLRREVSELRVG